MASRSDARDRPRTGGWIRFIIACVFIRRSDVGRVSRRVPRAGHRIALRDLCV